MELIHVSALVSALHLLALALGLPGMVLRGRALRGPLDAAGLGRRFAADSAWGLAALLWLGTSLWRAFGGLEKGGRSTWPPRSSGPRWRSSAPSCCSSSGRWRPSSAGAGSAGAGGCPTPGRPGASP